MYRGNVRVRPATAGDAAAFVGFVGELRRATGGRTTYPRAASHGDDEELTARFGELLAGTRWQILMATDQESDEPLGMAILSQDEISALVGTPVVHLSHLVVTAEHRRRGIGRMLMCAAVQRAEEIGCDHMMVGITTGGREAHRFFARLGFAPLLSRRIATVTTLRRTLGLGEPGGP
ncbi:MAG TPA: GNAT family N-acetyltransferase, partial [Mycobacteriales bacterium]|nr:GNAT family N-acetyltransferase [Mycobacteriales bacterium]